MKTFIITLLMLFGLSLTSSAQLSKLTASNPLKGSGVNNWYSKINKTIDSVNAHTNRIWTLALGSSLDTSLLVWKARNDVISGNIYFTGGTTFGSTANFPTYNVNFNNGNGTTLTFNTSWTDIVIYPQQDHGGQCVTNNAFIMMYGSNLSTPSTEKSGVKALIMYPSYRAGLYTQVGVSTFNLGGSFTASDTIRSGHPNGAFSYFTAGGALVQSSTADIKRNIVPIDTLPALLERFMSVNPVRYQWKPVIFRRGFDSSLAGGKWFQMKIADRKLFKDSCNVADSLQAETKAEQQMIGFVAEDLYQYGFTSSPNAINQGELIAAIWRVVQRVIIKQQKMEARIDALEQRIKLLENR